VVELAPSLDSVAVPGRATEPIPSLDSLTVPARGADGGQVAVPAKESELKPVEAGQASAQAQELSFPDSAGGSPPRRC